MQTWNLGFSADGRHPLFTTEAARRAAVRLIYRHAGHCLVLFCVVDDHVHVIVYCSRAMAHKLKRALQLGLRAIAEPELEQAYLKEIRSRDHLEYQVKYLLGQLEHHRLPAHPARWSGSCFADIVGARIVDGVQLQWQKVLPRTRLADTWRTVGLPSAGIRPATDTQLEKAGVHAIAAAASAAVCCDPGMKGRNAHVVTARAMTVQLSLAAGLAGTDLARCLGIKRHWLAKLAVRPVGEELLAATRLRVAIDAALDAPLR